VEKKFFEKSKMAAGMKKKVIGVSTVYTQSDFEPKSFKSAVFHSVKSETEKLNSIPTINKPSLKIEILEFFHHRHEISDP
jgi:hypothetical protein